MVCDARRLVTTDVDTMPWDYIARAECARRSTRYASDLTNHEWDLV